MDFREMIAQQWARYERLSDREQWLVIGSSVFILLAFFVFFIWEPLHTAQKSAKNRYFDEMALQEELKGLQQRPAGALASSDQSLLAIVNASTAENGINLKRVEPRNDDSLRIWVDNIPFNQLMGWVSVLKNQHGVNVETISMDRTESSGYINTALVLTK